ncbi:alpha/beta fold hydrolase [Acinetobacter sp. ANC 4173]|uniref:alpha/beta fold hydrolase n=1 Tax=Acinetobacter sp. ANC 4173 TaxID=2529837 RepID=UPI00103FFD3A|nr:alpha/beta hydrolase [Acinetobacter sp. ANC 4173]TCB77878.1 alpha/beta hydrolase [Acinetobacter sp. ANC 4173]
MPNLIFLPGASGSTTFWNPLINELSHAESNQVIAYPSFGEEPSQESVYDFASLSNYVLQQIQSESVLIAQSMGGIFAVQAAIARPDLVKGLVLLATSGGIDLAPFQVQDWRTAYQQQYLNYPDWFMATQIDLSQQLEKIRMPVLLLWGDQDPISPIAVGQTLQQKLPQAQLHLIHGGDHAFGEHHAKEVAAHIQQYLTHFNFEV